MNNFIKKYCEEFEKELSQFTFLCGKRDNIILLAQNNKALREDDIRLAALSIIFGYRKIFLKISAIAENNIDDFLKKLDGVSFDKLCEWATEFINNVPNPDARELARELWQDRKKALDPNDFNMRQLFI